MQVLETSRRVACRRKLQIGQIGVLLLPRYLIPCLLSKLTWQSYTASSLSLNAYYDSSLHKTRNSLVVGLNEVISQLLNGHGSVSCDNVLSVVCDENGEVSLDNDNTLSSLDTVLARDSKETEVV